MSEKLLPSLLHAGVVEERVKLSLSKKNLIAGLDYIARKGADTYTNIQCTQTEKHHQMIGDAVRVERRRKKTFQSAY